MSHDTFPKTSDTHKPEEQNSGKRVIVEATETDDFERIVKWFREAHAAGYDFAYHQAPEPQSDRKIMFVAKGFDSSRVLRVLLDEEKLPDT